MLLILSLEQEGVYIVWKEEVINSKEGSKSKVNDHKLKCKGF